jgi:DNA topoisomerase-1
MIKLISLLLVFAMMTMGASLAEGMLVTYFSHAGENYKLPKGTIAEDLTLEQCQEIIANEANKSKGGAKKKTTRAKKK